MAMNLARFWRRLLLEMKPRFIISNLSQNESMQWHKKGTPPPKKFKVSESAGKMMATVFWDCEGILLVDYKEKGTTITGDYYASILEKSPSKKKFEEN